MFTIGHSTRPIDELLDLLKAHGVKRVVDVRTIPRSRHNPQFDVEALPQSLLSAGIAYEHMPSLGGLRHARKDSPNDGWRNASFRGFADYMQTEEFANGAGATDGARRAGSRRRFSAPKRCPGAAIALSSATR